MRNRLTVKRYIKEPKPGARKAPRTIRERLRQIIFGKRYIILSVSRVTSIEHAFGRLREYKTKDVISATWFDGKGCSTDLIRKGKYIDQSFRINTIDKSLAK